jgi:hypothetical protein
MCVFGHGRVHENHLILVQDGFGFPVLFLGLPIRGLDTLSWIL